MNALARSASLAVALLAFGCTKAEPEKAPAKPDPSDIPTFKIVGSPASALPSASAAAASASPPVTASAPTSAPSASPSASARAAPSAAAASASAASAGAPLKPASTRLSGKNFTLDVASPGCRANEPCTVTLRLGVSGDYHVNKEYPYKFIGAAAPNVTFLAEGGTFTRATGDFKEEGEKSATMTVRFKAAAPGEAKISGTYKMSVCSAENCQIEQPAVSLAVPVM